MKRCNREKSALPTHSIIKIISVISKRTRDIDLCTNHFGGQAKRIVLIHAVLFVFPYDSRLMGHTVYSVLRAASTLF